ncbi:MAG TPA: hypothetical protein VMI35_09810 [Puia sp.]|nr:hypothetical protein [Puia sp.]
MDRIDTMPVKPLITSVTGLALLVPASYFSFTVLLRILNGSSLLYYSIAPAFKQNAFHLFPLHVSQLILYGPLLAVLINVMTVWRIRIRVSGNRLTGTFFYRSYGLNTAIALQAALLWLMMLAYLLILR